MFKKNPLQCYAPFSVLMAFLLSGCPLTDDYFVADDLTGGTGGSTSGSAGKQDKAGSGGMAGATGSAGAAACSECPPGCTKSTYSAHSYMFCTRPLAHPAATTVCASLDMTLAIIADALENDWVLQTFRTTNAVSYIRAFLGATDLEIEGVWTWVDGRIFWRGDASGKAEAQSFVPWEPAQPNNFSPVTLTAEHCLTLTFANGTWNDMRCELELPYVCEGRE